MTMITNLLLQRLKSHLTAAMITSVAEDNPTRAGTVKIGRFQDNPVKSAIYISISGGDQSDPELIDGILDARAQSPGWQTGFNMFSREIGGDAEGHSSAFWWRRGRIQVGCFFIKTPMSEEEAAENAYEVLGRLTYAVDHCSVANIRDDYGEQAILLTAFASNFFESGGPPNQYIWRGSVKWQCLTGRSR
jgi:hypothetical protein